MYVARSEVNRRCSNRAAWRTILMAVLPQSVLLDNRGDKGTRLHTGQLEVPAGVPGDPPLASHSSPMFTVKLTTGPNDF